MRAAGQPDFFPELASLSLYRRHNRAQKGNFEEFATAPDVPLEYSELPPEEAPPIKTTASDAQRASVASEHARHERAVAKQASEPGKKKKGNWLVRKLVPACMRPTLPEDAFDSARPGGPPGGGNDVCLWSRHRRGGSRRGAARGG